MKAKEKAEKTGGGEDGEDGGHDDDDEPDHGQKTATRKSSYTMCVQAGLCE